MEHLEFCFYRLKALGLIQRELNQEPEPTARKRPTWVKKLYWPWKKRPTNVQINPRGTSFTNKTLSQLCNNASLDRNSLNKS
jgi:hypothetical protein